MHPARSRRGIAAAARPSAPDQSPGAIVVGSTKDEAGGLFGGSQNVALVGSYWGVETVRIAPR
jgi:hypothetical protein